MNKYIFILFAALLVLPISNVHASTQITYPNAQAVLYPGQQVGLVWEGEDGGITDYAVYLVGGKLGDTGSVFLGTASASQKYFTFTVPEDIKQGSGYVIQMSGKRVTGDDSEKFRIKKDSKKITLESLHSGMIQDGGSNIIKWKGGRTTVQVGVVDANDTNSILGWVYLKGKPNSEFEWDGKQVCDLTMTVCWNLRGLGGATAYKIVVVSKDIDGNLLLKGNSDMSDGNLILGTSVISANDTRIQYLRAEINRLQKELDALLKQ